VEVFCKLDRLPAGDGEENSRYVQNELAVAPEGNEFELIRRCCVRTFVMRD
jgi:hypothetical protein